VTVADAFDRALDGDGGHGSAPPSVRALVSIAAEVAEALAATRLTRAERDLIYARSLAMLEDAVREQRRGWQRVLRVQRPVPVLVGGAAALALGAAAIGWAVLHDRGEHGPVAA
jgi:2-phosphoglycerate kinase